MPEANGSSEQSVTFPSRIIWEPDGKEMILLSGGEFIMGRDDGRGNEGPQHTVCLDPFYIDRYPITQADYYCFIQATDHPIPHYHARWLDSQEYNWDPDTCMPPADKLDHPVVLVSWQDAQDYCEWALKRLPTEAEWERAARSTDGRRWPWGNEFGQSHCNTKELGMDRTTTVYRFSPQCTSPEGVEDLIGNVWEWTSSLYWPYLYDAEDGREGQAARGWRVLRGGSWMNALTLANSTSRLDGDFVFYTNVGFRCAVSADVVAAALEGCSEE